MSHEEILGIDKSVAPCNDSLRNGTSTKCVRDKKNTEGRNSSGTRTRNSKDSSRASKVCVCVSVCLSVCVRSEERRVGKECW